MPSAIPFAPVPAGSDLKPIPGDPGLPLVGYTLKLIRDPLGTGRERYERYGPISWANAFGMKMVSMIGPDANEFVLRNKDDVFSNHQGWDVFIGKFFHRGIMLLDFEEHRWHRKIMQQAFKTDVLRDYIARMGPGIQAGLADWQPAERFMIFPAIKQLTLDLATDVFMGQKLGREADSINKAFIDTVRAGTALLRFNMPGGRWAKGLHGRRVLEDFFRREVPAKRLSSEGDLFSVLCRAETEDGESFTDDDVVNHMIFLMMAAHDTTTITLSNMIYWLARHPEWQARIREESLALGKTQLDYDDLGKLHSAGLAMKEALRLCAPVPSVPRRTVRDCEFQGYHVPAGTLVSISPFFTHAMPEYWPEPEKFDPERFSEARREDKVHPYAWVPFGGGAHKCIGLHFAELQVKAVLHQLVLGFEWEVDPAYRMPLDMTSLPVPKDDLPVRLRRRS
ncbi:MAG: cytochrome P450 [Alcanivorax sp.]|nr:cytochrome P450 [Alcanivorax sp.]